MTEVQLDWGYDRFSRRHRWTATLPNGEVRSHPEREAIHDGVRALVPDVKFTYTPAAWQQNVTQFERSRHGRHR